MEVFGIMGMSFGTFGLIAFVLSVNLTKKIDGLEKRIIELENK